MDKSPRCLGKGTGPLVRGKLGADSCRTQVRRKAATEVPTWAKSWPGDGVLGQAQGGQPMAPLQHTGSPPTRGSRAKGAAHFSELRGSRRPSG